MMTPVVSLWFIVRPWDNINHQQVCHWSLRKIQHLWHFGCREWIIAALIQTYLVQHGWCPQQRLTFLRWCFVMRNVIQGRSLVLRVTSCTSRRSICLSTRTQTLQSSSRRSAVRLSHSWSGSICHDLSCLKQSIIRFIIFIWPNHIRTMVFSCSVLFLLMSNVKADIDIGRNQARLRLKMRWDLRCWLVLLTQGLKNSSTLTLI